MFTRKQVFGFLLFLAVGAGAQRPAPDSVVVAANASLYQPRSFLRRWLMGSNYRESWQEPVRVPVFRLSASGFQAKELGGGMQTKSLRLVDSAGRQWALRTVNKQITNEGLSPALRNPVGRQFSQDFISSAPPFAAPLAGEIAYAAGLTVARPKVYYVATDSAFPPEWQTHFAGQLCTLEERDPGFDSTFSSEEMAAGLQRYSNRKVQPAVYLKARLVDMLLADWDRHPGNWRWGLKDSGGLQYYWVVPRDRDWAFYRSEGLLPWLSRFTAPLRYLINFGDDFGNVKNMNWKCWTMDKFFAGELAEGDWKKAVMDLQTALTDESIEAAVRVLPQAVYQKEGAWYVRTLKNRRNGLMPAALNYYRFLSEEAVVNGSDEAEIFKLTSQDGDLWVRVVSAADTSKLLYQRRFVSGETHALALNGFGGDDLFWMDAKAASKIRVTLNGGPGQNRYQGGKGLRLRIVEDGQPKRLTAATGSVQISGGGNQTAAAHIP